MRFVIVTGMSGGGKNTAMRMLEDMGFYCVDNLPFPLIEKFMELLSEPNTEISRVAMGVDVRTDQSFLQVERILHALRQNGMPFEILFIDTSKLLTRELKEELDRIFVKNEEYNSLMINILSFGFKHGIPADADLVFDVRFLPNPFYIDELKEMTGNDRAVQDYVMSFPEAGVFLDRLTELLLFLIPNYVREGKYQLVIGIGCTGGKHRSVTMANELYRRLKSPGAGYGVTLSHRDI